MAFSKGTLPMRPSVRLGRISGIDVGLHWSIALIAGLLTVTLYGSVLPEYAPDYGGAAYLLAALVTAAAFLASIVAHELGHSLVAIRNGIRVKGVTLFALGGVASLDGEPATAGAAGRVALAGPAVSVGVGGASLGLAVLAGTLGLPQLAVVALVWLGLINLSLAVFNMLPALPLDGGRVLQAWLWHRRGDRHGATISAAGVGRWIGYGLILVGFWELSQGATTGLWTAFIGWFVITNARGEARQARFEQARARGQVEFPFPFPFPFPAPPSGGSRVPGAGPWGPPRAEDRVPADIVIDVDGRLVDGPVGTRR